MLDGQCRQDGISGECMGVSRRSVRSKLLGEVGDEEVEAICKLCRNLEGLNVPQWRQVWTRRLRIGGHGAVVEVAASDPSIAKSGRQGFVWGLVGLQFNSAAINNSLLRTDTVLH